MTTAVSRPIPTPEPAGGHPLRVGPQQSRVLEPPLPYTAAFHRGCALVLQDLLDPGLLDRLRARCRNGQFVLDTVAGIGTREVEAPQRAGAVLNLALSRPNLLGWVEAVTGFTGLARVEGRVVQTRANGQDALGWHDDREPRRRLALTIDLSDHRYEGGEFELRRKGSIEPLLRFRHERPGTALLFAIGPALEHRLLPVRAGGPRRVFTGWFFAGPHAP